MDLSKYLQPVAINDGTNKKLLVAEQTQAKINELLLIHKDEIEKTYNNELKAMEEKQKQADDIKKLKEYDDKLKEDKITTKKLAFHQLLIAEFGKSRLDESYNNGNCVVCGEWAKHHQYFKGYDFSTCCPNEFLKFRDPNNECFQPNYDDQYLDEDEKLENYERMLNRECVNRVRKLFGLDNIGDCGSDTNCRSNWRL